MSRKTIRLFSIYALLILSMIAISAAVYAEETICDGYTAGSFNGRPACTKDGQLHICSHNFPDDNFRQFVAQLFSADPTQILEGTVLIQQSAVNTVTNISCGSENIASLQGIEFFTSLTKLYCYGNKLSTLDLSCNLQLREIDCSGNALTSLVVPQENLNILNCSKNKLTELDLTSAPYLRQLFCSNNRLRSLKLDGYALWSLDCSFNKLTELDFSECPNLTSITCGWNSLSSLDVSMLPKLFSLNCKDNNIRELDLRGKKELISVRCANNKLEKLDIHDTPKLKYLECENNKLSELDLSNKPELHYLHCFNNALLSLELSQPHNLASVDLGTQTATISAPLSFLEDGSYTIDIGQLVGSHNLDKVTKVRTIAYPNRRITYDAATGIATVYEYVTRISYDLAVDGPSTTYTMNVTVDLQCSHNWVEATCTSRKTCTICHDTEGTYEPHQLTEATKTEPPICKVCGKTEGHPLEHVWGEATCNQPMRCIYCKESQGKPLGHDYGEIDPCTGWKKCHRCGERQRVASSPTHDYVEEWGHILHCRLCGDRQQGNITEHTWVWDFPLIRRHCQYCNAVYSRLFYGYVFAGIYMVELTAAVWYLLDYKRERKY